MLNRFKKLCLGLVIAGLCLCAANAAGFINGANVQAKSVVAGRVKTPKLAIRKSKSRASKSLLTLSKGDSIKVLTINKKWVKVRKGKVTGFALGGCIKTKYGTAANHKTKGEKVVEYALHFLGNPYVYGGSSLTHGTDCSGFTMSIFRHFGRSLPHSSSAQRHYGRRVSSLSNAKPGDLICYSGHVGIYMGNNRVVHASNPQNDICIRYPAAYRHIVSIRRLVD